MGQNITSSCGLDQATHLFFRADLVLDSGLHIGTGDYDESRGQAACYRDARKNLVIPGTSLAGVFVDALQRSNLRDLEKDKNPPDKKERLLPRISGKGQKQDDFEASRLIFHCARPQSPEQANRATGRRDGIKIDRQTRTAAHGAKFAYEAAEPGLRFPFYLEVEFQPRDEPEWRKRLTAVVLAVLRHWEKPEAPVFLGASSARGAGWFHLENPKAALIANPEDFRSFLDSPAIKTWVDDFIKEKPDCLNEVATWAGDAGLTFQKTAAWKVRVRVIEDHDGYGAWPLLVRTPPGKGLVTEEDLTFVRTRCWQAPGPDGHQNPEETLYIPGSTLRGAARSLLERLAQGGVWSDKITQDAINKLFGDEDCNFGSRLHFREAYLEGDAPQEALVHHVALDEFTRGALEGAKFDETPLFAGTFSGRMILEEPKNGEEDLITLLTFWAEAGWVPLGAHNTPVHWKFQQVS